MNHSTLEQIYLYAKVIGSIGSAAGVIYGVLKWLTASYQQTKKTNQNFELLMTNHLPHIQASLDTHGTILQALSSDVRDVSTKVDGIETRLEDTKLGVHTLGESFLRHLENTSAESVKAGAFRKNVNTEIHEVRELREGSHKKVSRRT
jgi:hypothetical protein